MVWPFKRNKELISRLETLHHENRRIEKRLHEATRVNRPEAVPSPLFTRGYWDNRLIRNQTRFLYENDPITRTATEAFVANIVGKGIMPMVSSDDKMVKEVIETFFQFWLETAAPDWDQTHNLTGLFAAAVRAMFVDGDALLMRVVRKRTLQIRLLEIDFLDINRNGINRENGNRILDGMEYHKSTQQLVAYWIYEQHPDGSAGGLNLTGSDPIPGSVRGKMGMASFRVPASEICHLRKIERPGQQLGVSWLAPSLIKIWDLREYEESKLKQQKLQAGMAGTLEDNIAQTDQSAIGGLIKADFANKDIEVEEIRPGHIVRLPPGKKLNFMNPSGVPNEAFVERALRSVAGSLGMSYEIFNDYRGVTYSSGRMGFLAMDRYLKFVHKTILEPQMLNKIGAWVVEHLEINKLIPPEHFEKIHWTPPARDFIDPAAEGQALANLVGANLESHKNAMAKLGYDFYDKMAEIKESKDAMEALGLSPIAAFGGTVSQEDLIPKTGEENSENGTPEEEATEKEDQAL